MIPAWLTLKSLKLGAIGLIILAIFSAGWYTKGKLVEHKIIKLKTEKAVLESNYDLCYDNLRRSNANWLGLKDEVEKNNLEVIKQAEEYNLKVIELRELNREAINHINATHSEAINDMLAEASALRERMHTMSQAEACHEAMLEIVR